MIAALIVAGVAAGGVALVASTTPRPDTIWVAIGERRSEGFRNVDLTTTERDDLTMKLATEAGFVAEFRPSFMQTWLERLRAVVDSTYTAPPAAEVVFEFSGRIRRTNGELEREVVLRPGLDPTRWFRDQLTQALSRALKRVREGCPPEFSTGGPTPLCGFQQLNERNARVFGTRW